jgi:transcriptional regulator with XRE-family HTH domain
MMEKMNRSDEDDHAPACGRRLKDFRQRRGLTLDALAEASGVSRAMISRIERGEASPTAALLGRLCAALGVSMSGFFAAEDRTAPASPLSRRAAQPVWRDPATGYVRRNVSPRLPGSALEIVDVTFPAGERVSFDNPWSSRPTEQIVWVLEGTIELTVGDETHRLGPGDSLHMRLDRPVAYHNPGPTPARYAVVLAAQP